MSRDQAPEPAGAWDALRLADWETARIGFSAHIEEHLGDPAGDLPGGDGQAVLLGCAVEVSEERAAGGRPSAAALVTAAATSSESWQRATAAGRQSIEPLQTRRASS